jgi:RNA polymerase sigma-70 factor (ECF subfamily)
LGATDQGAAQVTLDQRDDAALMLAYRQGEADAFAVLLKRHQRGVFNFLMRLTSNRSAAEDLLQEVFLRVIKSAATYKREAKFTTWLYTIARNLVIDQSRRAKHRKALSLDKPLRGDEQGKRTMADLIPAKGISVDRSVQSNRLQERISHAIQTLSEEQREVFLMRERHNMPFKEIAEVVGCPENTVKSRMRYALEALRRELSDYRDVARAVN